MSDDEHNQGIEDASSRAAAVRAIEENNRLQREALRAQQRAEELIKAQQQAAELRRIEFDREMAETERRVQTADEEQLVVSELQYGSAAAGRLANEERVRAAGEERLVPQRLVGSKHKSRAEKDREEMDRRKRAVDENWRDAASRIPMRLASLVAQDQLTGAFARELGRSTGPIAPDRVLEFTERAW